MPGVALLGAGLFAKDVWLRTISNHPDAKFKAIWSRTHASCSQLHSQLATNELKTSVMALHGDDGLTALLSDASIDAVVVALPPAPALEMVKRFLAAGKAVACEKPIAGACDDVTAMIKSYQETPSTPIWFILENYRFESCFQRAIDLLPSCGKIIKLDLVAEMVMDASNKYYSSQWRRDTALQLSETSVHFLAALRMLANALGWGEAKEVSALSNHARDDLAGPDSVIGVVSFNEPGQMATVSITLASHFFNWSLRATGTQGTVEVSRGGWSGTRTGYELRYKIKDDPSGPQTNFLPFTGCDEEFNTFVKMVQGSLDPNSIVARRSRPVEGFNDLALIEALLLSGSKGGERVKVAEV
jgi:predicted dehydrogenase